MNKKVFYFAALVAACSTALVSCSSDDELAQESPVAPEVETVVPNNTESDPNLTDVPFGVYTSVEGDATRGVDLTASDFNKFYLYGVKTDDGSSWFNGTLFNKTSELWDNSTTAYRWSDGATTAWHAGSYNFYAVTSTTGITAPNFSVDTNEEPAVTTATFDYTVDPANVATQEDLMVAKNLNQSSTTNDGKLGLNFYHALASIEVWVNLDELNYIDEEDLEKSDKAVYSVWINKIIFHNIKSVGTFDFGQSSYDSPTAGTTGAWVSLSDYVNYEYTVTGTPEFTNIPKTNENAYTKLTFNEGSVFVIPQEVTPWAPNIGATLYPLPSGDNHASYIEIVCQVRMRYLDDTDGDCVYYIFDDKGGAFNNISEKEGAGFGSVYIPLKLTSGKFDFNKNYKLKLQLSTARSANGDIAIAGGKAEI